MKNKSLLLIFLLTSVLTVNGQILYTDFVPDTVLTAPNFNSIYSLKIDINQDGNNDFVLTLYTEYHQSTPLCCNSGCCACEQMNFGSLDTNSKIGWVDTLNTHSPCPHLTVDSGVVIDDASFFWRRDGFLIYHCTPIMLNCDQNLKKIIPVKLYLNGNYYFGWVRIFYHTIYDMAVNLTPNQAIVASQMLIGVEENENNNSINVFPNPFRNELTVSKTSNELSEFILYDVAGRVIMQKQFSNSLFIDTGSLENGIYIYDVRNKEKSFRKGTVVKY